MFIKETTSLDYKIIFKLNFFKFVYNYSYNKLT